jgi:hypothetical protein
MRWIFLALVVVHALIHFLGFAKAFGLAELPELTLPISRNLGLLWLAAGLGLLLSAVLLIVAPRVWWGSAALAIVVSQVAIACFWADARFGSVANALIALGVIYGFAAQGPLSLRAEYRSRVSQRGQPSAGAILTEADLGTLPPPMQCYLRQSGALGRPRVKHVKATWRGRIRGGPEDAWMDVVAEQHNFIDDPARYFFMDARRSGLPVDVFHAFEKGAATMRVRLLSLFGMVDAKGSELTRAETVTWLNDLCVLAPDSLIGAAAQWEAVDPRTARVRYMLGNNTVSALLSFNEACELVDFVSEDREKTSADGKSAERLPWSTPLRDYRSFGERRAASRGEGCWHPPQGAFTYIELELTGLQIDGKVSPTLDP